MKAHELKGQHFLKLLDFSPEQIQGLIDFAIELKKDEAGRCTASLL